jgi:hypothetical protein
MKCPRCGRRLTESEQASSFGAYRTGERPERGCDGCGHAIYGAAELAERLGTTDVELDRSPLCTLREPIDAPCGACGQDFRARLHLSWESLRGVVVEVCPRCRTIAIARKHADRLRELLESAEPMHRLGRAGLERQRM